MKKAFLILAFLLSPSLTHAFGQVEFITYPYREYTQAPTNAEPLGLVTLWLTARGDDVEVKGISVGIDEVKKAHRWGPVWAVTQEGYRSDKANFDEQGEAHLRFLEQLFIAQDKTQRITIMGKPNHTAPYHLPPTVKLKTITSDTPFIQEAETGFLDFRTAENGRKRRFEKGSVFLRGR